MCCPCKQEQHRGDMCGRKVNVALHPADDSSAIIVVSDEKTGIFVSVTYAKEGTVGGNECNGSHGEPLSNDSNLYKVGGKKIQAFTCEIGCF